jgi:uncharacterized membrane protein
MNEARNPYAPPNAPLEHFSMHVGEAGSLLANGRRVPVGNCTRWIKESYELFAQRPWKLIGTMLLLALISGVVSIVPFSNLLNAFLWPVVAGGMAYALDQLRQTRSFALSAVFSGFGPKFLPLATIGLVTLLSYAIMFVVFAVRLGSDVAMSIIGGGQKLSAIPAGFWSTMVLTMVFTIPMTAATYLAAPLIILHDTRPVAAMKMSFAGCMKNIVPWALSAVLMMLLIFLSAIPLLLGLFVTLPMAVMLFYPMYRDIFVEQREDS